MYRIMLTQELRGRARQTVIVAAGLAIAIALVIVVSALSTGVRQAQSAALEGVYGVGTDLTVTGSPETPDAGGGPRFEFDESAGTTSDGTTTLSQSRLMTQPGRGTLDADTVDAVRALDGVSATTGVLELTQTAFTGEMPDPSQMSSPGAETGGPGGGESGGAMPGGPDGAGGSAFAIESMSVLGVDPGTTTVGPLSGTTVTDGASFSAADANAEVALIDETYAASQELTVGDEIEVAGTEIEIIGVVASSGASADTAANLYLPIETARTLSGIDATVSAVYVSAESAGGIEALQAEIEAALPEVTVSSQADLAAQVSGSLASAASLIGSLGTWLSVVVLIVALCIAMLLTGSGVSRRTREFGTLKAIGWSNRRVVTQVAGESMLQSLIGGAAGLILGLGIVGIINAISPSISTSAASWGGNSGPGGVGPGTTGGGPGGGFEAGGADPSTASEIVFSAPVTPWIVGGAIALAVIGGVLAGAFGGWRVARLSPAEALRATT